MFEKDGPELRPALFYGKENDNSLLADRRTYLELFRKSYPEAPQPDRVISIEVRILCSGRHRDISPKLGEGAVRLQQMR